jgi:hypothetical protein
MPHDVQKLLIDIRSACDEIIQFTEDKSIDDFKKDRILQLALERQAMPRIALSTLECHIGCYLISKIFIVSTAVPLRSTARYIPLAIPLAFHSTVWEPALRLPPSTSRATRRPWMS